MSVRPDADLVRAAQAGDVASFEQLYARYQPVVHAILLGRLSPADADDVAQNVFITAYTRLQSLREPAAFAGWIARSASMVPSITSTDKSVCATLILRYLHDADAGESWCGTDTLVCAVARCKRLKL
jgi:hypothetical protein